MQPISKSVYNTIINKTPPKKRTLSQFSNPQSTQKNFNNHKNQLGFSSSEKAYSKLQQNKQKMIQTLGLFYLIQENNIPQRCITHNTDLSLYCMNQHKLICVNCVYLSKIHDKHKVSPSTVAANDIKKDNVAASYKIALNLNQIEDNQQNIQDYLQKGQMVRQTLMNNLQRQYEQIRKYIQNKYLALRIQIVQQFQQFKEHSQVLIKQLRSLKQVVNKKMSQLDFKQDKFQIEVYKHLVLNNLAEFTDLKDKLMKPVLNLEIMPQQMFDEIKKFKQHMHKYKWSKF